VNKNIIPVLKSVVNVYDWPSEWERGDSIKLLTAIMFAGLGGFWNLFNSYWVLSKKAGAAQDNDDEFTFDNGSIPDETTTEKKSVWNKFLHLHVGIGIVGNYLTTLMMCLLAFSFLTPSGQYPYGWKLAVVQSQFFSGIPYGQQIFLGIAALFLIDTWLTTLDAVSKVQTDVLQMYFPEALSGLKPRSVYYFMAVLILILTFITMFLSQPDVLLLINGYISAAAMPMIILLVFLVNYVLLKKKYFGGQFFIRMMMLLSLLVYAVLFVLYYINS